MSFETHLRRGHPIMFTLIIVFSIIELAISAWLTSRFNKYHNYFNLGERDRTRFLLFTSVWTIFFSLIYMGAFFFRQGNILSSIGSHLIFLFITWVFWTAGAAAITSSLGGGLDCGFGAPVYCGQLNALEAFAWVVWVLVTLLFATIVVRGIIVSRRGDGLRDPLVWR